MISHQHKCIFIHIPKCAGSSVEDLLWPGKRSEADLWMGFVDRFHNRHQTGGLQHLTASLVRSEVGEETFQSYFKFAIVRNPWDKAASQFAYMERRPDLCEFVGLRPNGDFETYLSAIARTPHVQWQDQYSFLYGSNGELLVDRIIRYESLASDLPSVLRAVGIQSDCIPHANPSPRRRPTSELYNDRTQQRVADLYRRDIAAFDYSFPV